MSSWTQPARALDADALRGLISGALPAVHIANFASAEECAGACRAIRDPRTRRRAATTTQMDLIGSNFSNHAGARKSDYFDTVPGAFADQQAVFGNAFDVMGRVLGALRNAWPGSVDYAEEPTPYGRYFAGGVKTRVRPSRLHFDYVPHFAPDYAIGAVVDQLAWNLYLDMPSGTGETTLYRAPVSREQSPADTEDGYTALPERHVAGAERYVFRPGVGELVLFNTRHPHRVALSEPGPGESRIQVGSFIGRLADDRLVLWS